MESSRTEKKDVELSGLIELFVSCPTVKAGVLLKQGGKLRRKWQSRYFYLKCGSEGTALLYTDGPCFESICACGMIHDLVGPTATNSKFCPRCGRSKKPNPKNWPPLTSARVLGLIQINGAWIHKLQVPPPNKDDKSMEEFANRPMFGISRSNKDKMIVLSTATEDEREEWMSLMVIQGALKFDSSGKSRIHMDSAKEGYLRALSPKINKGKWTRAYFVLTQSHSLQCFLSYKTDPHMLHEIPLRGSKVQAEPNELYNQVFTFSVLPPDPGAKPTILVAETEIEQKDWMSCLSQSSAGKTARPHVRRKSDSEEPSEEGAFVSDKTLLPGGNKRNQESIMEGKLEVVERNLGVVKRKTFYFVLRGAHLAYFVHRSDYKPAGDISLSGCEVKLLSDLVGKLGFVLRPARRKKRYELHAKTTQELNEWVGALQAQIAALKRISDGVMEAVDIGKETDVFHGVHRHYTSLDPLMEGNMMKKGKRRYFRAYNDALIYSKARLDTRPRGVIELASCGLKIEDAMEGYIFSLQPITHTEDRKFILGLNSLEELEAWTNMLRALIARESVTKVDPHGSIKEGFLWKVSPRDVRIRYLVLSSSSVLSVYKSKRHAKEVMSEGTESPLMTINLLKATVTKEESMKLPSDTPTKVNPDFIFTVLPAPDQDPNAPKGREHSFIAESRLVMQQWMDVIKASADLARDMHSLVYNREIEFQSELVPLPHLDCTLDEVYWPRACDDDLSELTAFLSAQFVATISTEKGTGKEANLNQYDDPTRQAALSSEGFFEKLRQEEKDRQEASRLKRQQIAERVEAKDPKKIEVREPSPNMSPLNRKFSASSNPPQSDDDPDPDSPSLSPRNSEIKEGKDIELEFAEIHFDRPERKFGAVSSEDEDDDDEKKTKQKAKLKTAANNETAEAFLVENFGRAVPSRDRYRSDFMLVQTGAESNSYAMMETGVVDANTMLTAKQCEKLLTHLQEAKFAPESMQALMDRLAILCALPENAQLLLQCGASDVLGAIMKQWNEVEPVFYAVATVFATIHENAALMQDISAKVDVDPLSVLIPANERDGGLKESACVLKALGEAKPGQIEPRTLQLLLDRMGALCQKPANASFLQGSDTAPTLVSLMHVWETDEEVCLFLAEAHSRLSESIPEIGNSGTKPEKPKKSPPPPPTKTASGLNGAVKTPEMKPKPSPARTAPPPPNQSPKPAPASSQSPGTNAPTATTSTATTITSTTTSTITSTTGTTTVTTVATPAKPAHPARKTFSSRISSARRGGEAEMGQSTELLIKRVQQSCAAKETDKTRSKPMVSEVVNIFKSMEEKKAATTYRSRVSRGDLDTTTLPVLRSVARELAWRSQDVAPLAPAALRVIITNFIQLLKFHLEDADLVVSSCAAITNVFKRGTEAREFRDDALEEQAISLLIETLSMEYYGDSPEVKFHAVGALTAFLRNKSSATARLVRKYGGMGALLTVKKNNTKHGLLVQACTDAITAINQC